MSFALLAPAALALAALLAGPILAHLVRRKPDERRAYGAMLLLERLKRRVERRRRLHDRLLLLLRLLAVALFILAIARPEVHLPETNAPVGASGHVVVILDTSLSMDQRAGGESAFLRAQREAARAVRDLPEGTLVAVFAAGLPQEPLVPTWSADHALAASLIEAARQAAGATDLDGALTQARTLLGGKPGEVLVYTDGSGPGNVAAAQNSLARLLATGSVILPRMVGVADPTNVVVSDARYGDGLEGGTVTVKVRSYGAAAVEVPATVQLPDGAQMTVFVQVPGATADGPGEATAAVTVPRQAAGGVASVTVTDPGLPQDDARYFHLPRVGQSRVLVVDGDPGSSPTKSEVYFLERALAPNTGGGAALDVVAPAGITKLTEGQARVAIVANVGDPTPMAPTLIDFVREGGSLVLAVGDNVSAAVWNSALAPILPATLSRPRDLASTDTESSGLALAPPGVDVELFEPFAQAGRTGFARVHSRRIFAVEGYVEGEGTETLLRYEGGAPALISREVGTGHVLLWTSTLDLGWSNFPLQSIYAPFCARLVGWLGGEVGSSASRLDGTVGQPVAVPLPAGQELSVTGPSGERVGVTRLPGTIQFVPEVPGAYAVGRPGEPPSTWVAVNGSPRESDVRPDETITEATTRIDPANTGRVVPLDTALALAAAVALLAASWLGRGALPAEEGGA